MQLCLQGQHVILLPVSIYVHQIRSLHLRTMHGYPRCGKLALMLNMEQPSELPSLVPVYTQKHMETDFWHTARAHTAFSMVFSAPVFQATLVS